MDILIPDSWLREFLSTTAKPKQIQQALSLSGPSIERLRETGNDVVYSIEVTTNRVDCMSVYGIAREAAAILPRFDHPTTLLSDPFSSKHALKHQPEVAYLKLDLDTMLCPNFAAILVKGVKVTASPDWLVKKLASVDIRPINNLVDITNLLTHELGQPLHVFDYDQIKKHHLVVRESKAGEKVTTLDGKEHTLPGHDIVIADGSGELIDLSGIMGGKNSSVTDSTTNVLVFVQTYEPVHIRKTSMQLAARSTAAMLFEKGLTQETVLPTLHKAVEHITELAGGQAEPEALVRLSEDTPTDLIHLSSPLTEFVNSRLGTSLNLTEIKKILSSLQFKVISETQVMVPWFRRLDIELPEDLCEEVARLYGYHNVNSELMPGVIPSAPTNTEFYWTAKIKQYLKHVGFTENYTYSLVSSDTGLKLKNPLTNDLVYLRTQLTPSHLELVSQNLGRVEELNFFEIANIYLPVKNNLPTEEPRLVITTTNPDYFNLKGIVEGLAREIGCPLPTDIHSHINPKCQTVEISLPQVFTQASFMRRYTPISKFNALYEDVNITTSASFADIVKKISKVSPHVKQVDLIDTYENRITVRITFHSDHKQLSTTDLEPIRADLEKMKF